MNTGHICISVCAKTADDLLADIRRAEPLADLIEVRFDRLDEDQLTPAINTIQRAGVSKPLIATYRSPEQGGDREIARDERLAFWNSVGYGFEFVDLEQDVATDVHFTSRIVASQHDFTGVPVDVDAIYEKLAASGLAVIKIAGTAHDICDAIPIWKLLARAKSGNREVIPIAMGDAGKWTRILGLAHGAFLTYASLDAGKETAGGQITAEDLINVYRVKDLDRDTRVYGVIGDPVSSSLSPYMHNAAFTAEGLNAVFLPLQVRDLDAFMRRMVVPATREVNLNFAGFSVTMPHKQAIQKYLTDIDPVAEKIGAVNTVKIDGDRISGYNTDSPGFIGPLKTRFPDLENARVAVLGAGGAARAVVYALRQEGADITVYARDPQKALPLAEQFGVAVSDLAAIHRPPSAIDIIVNTTPLGMRGPHESETPLTSDQLSGVKFVYDLVTRRDDTPLLREAKHAGVDCIGGVEMLIAQGVKQFDVWTGLEAPADLMRAAVVDRLK